MAHELATIRNKTAMFYADGVPWHKLGTQLEGRATSREAIKAASLDWKVFKEPLYIKVGSRYQLVPGHFATVRADPDKPKMPQVLGVVGATYTPLQNEDAFDWFDSIVGKEAAIFETAGALGNGERVWMLAKLPGYIRVAKDDIVNKYLLLSNSHDGKSGVQVKFTPIRVVCQNTLTMALQEGRTITIRHTRSVEEDLKQAQTNLGIINDRFVKIEKEFTRLQKTAVNTALITSYLQTVFPDPTNMDDQSALKRSVEMREQSMGLFETGRGNSLSDVRGTLWAAYNGVTEFVDYNMGKRTTPEGRLDSAWFGNGYLIKVRAFRIALELAAKGTN